MRKIVYWPLFGQGTKGKSEVQRYMFTLEREQSKFVAHLAIDEGIQPQQMMRKLMEEAIIARGYAISRNPEHKEPNDAP